MTRLGSVITALKTDRGLALQDLLAGAYEYIDTIEFPPAARVYLLDQFATTESAVFLPSGTTSCSPHDRYRLSAGANERIQLTALLGAFKNAVELTANAKSKE
jgi:replication factor C subunit 3/5